MSASQIELVRKMAELARLAIQEDEARELGQQFGRILEHFQVLTEIDVTGVEATTGAASPSAAQREDLPRPGFSVEQALANAPLRSDDFYRVPKTVGGEE